MDPARRLSSMWVPDVRALLVGDIETATAVLAARPENEWRKHAAAMLRTAHSADKYRKRLGRAHPGWGDGSLATAARAHGAARWPARHDARVLRAQMVLIETILARVEHPHLY